MSWRKVAMTALILVLLIPAVPTPLAGAGSQEYQVKAAFIHNVAKFVQWPATTLIDPEEPFGLYILGEDRFGEAFDTFKGSMLHNMPLVVGKIESWEDIPADCRILFIGVPERTEIQRVLAKVSDKAILTISDEPGFGEMGGMIGLVTENQKIRFTVNTFSARKCGLMISSNILKLARSIYGEML